jgi:outer membrane protein assembly factor BamD (BamD/ComL family)
MPPGDSRRKAFRAAAKQFEKAADQWPESDLEQQARFFQGESYLFSDDLTDCEHAFKELIKSHPRTRFMPLVQARRFEIAQYWIARGREESAYELINFTDETRPWISTERTGLGLLDKMRFDDATGKLADDTNMELARQNFLRGDYDKADEVFNDLREAYPDSPHQFHAHLLGVRCKLAVYRGAHYGGDRLFEAEQLHKDTVRKFPNEVQRPEFRDLVNDSYMEIRFKLAERLMQAGRYRQRRGENGAAERYYRQMVERYPDVDTLVEEAQVRIGQVEGKPHKPKRYFEELAEIFPDGDKAKPLITSNGETILR